MADHPPDWNSLTGDESLELPEFDRPPAEPIALLRRWLETAQDTVREPLAATLCTSTWDGGPSSRTILVKGVEEDGTIIVTTSYRTRKANELDQARRASLTFYWRETVQQILITGDAERISDVDAQTLFDHRPPAAQAASAVSTPGRPLDDESAMSRRAREMVDSGSVQRPDDWGGYRIRPDLVEFWHGRRTRLHRRLLFERTGDGWTFTRLQA